MNYFDYIIVALYLGFFLFLGYKLKGGESKDDYFLGGRSFGWFTLAISTMATQLSAISFISAPAFVGIRQGGGMQWLTYEFAVPMAMLILMFTITPRLYRSGIVSVYEFLEDRFDVSTRLFLSVLFQFSRAFATGIMVYTLGIILQSVLEIEYWQTVVLIGVITIIYSSKGGMKAVVYGDVIQMAVVVLGIFICMAYALSNLGGWDSFLANLDKSRLEAVDYNSFGFNGDGFGFLPMIFGGLVLYISYYGCDQTQVQRAISAQDERVLQRVLLANGLLRFPITVLFCFLGLIMGTFAFTSPEFMALIPQDQTDRMMPIFIKEYLPHGLIGLLVVALFSAAMSSLSSVINSLTAVTMEDFVQKFNPEMNEGQYKWSARICAVSWGTIMIITSFFAGNIADTIIEAINKVGSVFYGPIAALFILGLFFKGTNALGAKLGLAIGVAFNIYLWLAQENIFWFWWNFIGFAVTVFVAVVVSKLSKNSESVELGENSLLNKINSGGMESVPSSYVMILIGYTVAIILFATYLPSFF